MTSIVFLIEAILERSSDDIISETKKYFPNLFLAFWKWRFNVEHFQGKDDLMADVFLNLQTSKKVVR